MAHKKWHNAPVPAGNKSPVGPVDAGKSAKIGAAEIQSAQENDPNRNLGDFDNKGEHSIQEPGGKKNANH